MVTLAQYHAWGKNLPPNSRVWLRDDLYNDIRARLILESGPRPIEPGAYESPYMWFRSVKIYPRKMYRLTRTHTWGEPFTGVCLSCGVTATLVPAIEYGCYEFAFSGCCLAPRFVLLTNNPRKRGVITGISE